MEQPILRPCGPPPPSGVYNSLEEAWEAIGRHAAANGYRVVKNGSKKGNALFRCAKGRIYKSKANSEVHESKRRKTSSQFTGCPFKFKAKPLPNGQWALKVPEGIAHNHGRNEETAFAASRAEKLKPLEQEVIELANKGVRPAQILGKIHADELGILGKDIHNLLQRHRRGELKGRSPLQALYEDHLTSQGSLFVWKDTRDAQNRVTSLTIAPKTGLELLKQNSDLLLLDATYKTNCHNMPMFNACGVTHCNKVFSWAVTFISGEQESHYQVALEHQISILEDEGIPKPGVIVSDRELALLKALNKSSWAAVPHLLCRWHVNMNVLAKARRHFPPATKVGAEYQRHPKFKEFLKEWNTLLNASTEEVYESTLAKFKAPGRHPEEAVKYVIKTWLGPWKEKLVAAWTNKVPHMGHVTTSAVESAHSAIKKYLISSKADLKSVFDRLCLF